jgi:hypothetical protein
MLSVTKLKSFGDRCLPNSRRIFMTSRISHCQALLTNEGTDTYRIHRLPGRPQYHDVHRGDCPLVPL